jgi:GNAT superfamily N-acetyltransferase
MIKFQVECLDTCLEDSQSLLKKHWEEIALNKDQVPLDPDWLTYQSLDENGRLFIITARDEGRLVGYSVYFLSRNFHYQSLFVAESDIFYLLPEYRKGLVGMKLLKFSEQALKNIGVNKIVSRIKIKNDIGLIFERMGFEPIERVYAKLI